MDHQPVHQEEQYRYFAFISYSRKDMPWAKWLQSTLQNYLLPSKLIRTHKELPKRMTPVFRDQQDISGNVLENALHQALDDSRFLIVICSPNSARSIYVNEEVRYFVSLGRQEQIIPLIVDGSAFSGDPETECFPEALRAITPELLGINVKEHGKHRAFLRVVSTMLHIHHDEIFRRDGTRRMIRRLTAACAALILAAAGCWGIWFNTPHSKYYNAYTTRYEIPEGICELTEEQVAVTSDCYRITRLRGKVIRLETVNALGTVTDPVVSSSLTDYPRQEFVRFDDRGRPIEIHLYDSKGNLVLQKKLSYGGLEDQIIIDFQKPGSGMSAVSESAGSSQDTPANNSNVIRQINTYDQSGLLIQCKYYKNTTGTPTGDGYGVYSKTYTYTENGLIASVTNLDRSGDIIRHGACASVEIFRYDPSGTMIHSAEYDAMGENPLGTLLYEKRCEVDSATGNVTAIRYYGKAQTPIDRNGYHEVRAEYNAQGFKIGQRYFDTDGNPIALGVCHEIQWKYDENGRKSAQLHFDINRDPVISDGVHEVRWEYAPNGAETAQRHFDTAGNPMLRGGFHALIQVYDEHGRVIAKQFFGTEGEPVMPDGFHEVRGEYDEKGNCVSLAFFDAQGAPAEKDGYHKLRTEYDDSGNITSFRHFGNEDQPITVDGFHEIRTEYNENNEPVSMRYFDENREPALLDGIHETRFVYDELGNLTSLMFFGLDRKPILLGGYHELRTEYDAQGNVLTERYFDADGKPAHFQNYHEVFYMYDGSGRLIATRYLDWEQDPVYGPSGYHELRCTYDLQGNLTSARFFGTDRKPMLCDGYHELRWTYNAQGVTLRTAGYDTEGNLVFEF